LVGVFVLLSCYIIVCNELAFCFLYFLSYLFPLVLPYTSFSSYDTRVALDHFACSLCCRTCLNIYPSCSPMQRANTHNYSINTQLSISTKPGSLCTPLRLEDDQHVPGGRRRINTVFLSIDFQIRHHPRVTAWRGGAVQEPDICPRERVGSNLNLPIFIFIVHSTWQIH